MRIIRINLGNHGQTVWVAETFWERLRGLMGRSPNLAMLIPGRSVHSMGMRQSMVVLALDCEYTVIAQRRLRPGDLWMVPRARWMLELPVTVEPPPCGTELELLMEG